MSGTLHAANLRLILNNLYASSSVISECRTRSMFWELLGVTPKQKTTKTNVLLFCPNFFCCCCCIHCTTLLVSDLLELRIDFTSFICVISSATEQILAAYQPIKESKNAVTHFLSLKCIQSPADYSINLLMNLSSRQIHWAFLSRRGEHLKGFEPRKWKLQTLKVCVEVEIFMLILSGCFWFSLNHLLK